eukprot:3400324-Prymnesium_polylepis.1
MWGRYGFSVRTFRGQTFRLSLDHPPPLPLQSLPKVPRTVGCRVDELQPTSGAQRTRPTPCRTASR